MIIRYLDPYISLGDYTSSLSCLPLIGCFLDLYLYRSRFMNL